MVTLFRFPSLASIRAFEAAARLGGFAQAAAELATTAASVSYHVSQLERQIGVPLFKRHAQKVALTPVGASIAREAMNAFAMLRASFSTAVDADESRLSLTTLPTFGSSWLTPRLGEFRKRHPQIALDIDLSSDAHELGDGRFDAAIRNGYGRWPGLRTIKLLPSIFMPLCAPKLRAAAGALANPRRRSSCLCSADLTGGRCGIARADSTRAHRAINSELASPPNTWTSPRHSPGMASQ